MPATYLFYDLETSGLNKCFDGIMQIAMIRTDEDFNILKEDDILVRLNPDIAPSPGAVITHRIDPLACETASLNEYEAITKIHAEFNEANTISIGYNTLKFDDEFLRFVFDRTLLDPYTHQWKDGCYRMDLFPLTAAYYALCPDALEWPRLEEDKISLRLEHLSSQNKLAEGQAHNALVDVRATIALAKKLRDANRELWQQLTSQFRKNTDLDLQASLPQTKEGYCCAYLINGVHGATNHFLRPYIFLGAHNVYKNQGVWLPLDSVDFTTLNSAAIIEQVFSLFRKPADRFLLCEPNAETRALLSENSSTLARKNVRHLQTHPELFQELVNYHCNYTYPTVDDIDLDASLYGRRFASPADKATMLRFHIGNAKQKQQLMQTVSDPLLRKRMLRVLWRNFAELLTIGEAQEAEHELTAKQIDFKGQTKLSFAEALQACKTFATDTLDEEQKQLLIDLQHYLQTKQACEAASTTEPPSFSQ